MEKTYYVPSTNKLKLDLAKDIASYLSSSDSLVIPITPEFNGEPVKRESFIGPITKKQMEGDRESSFSRPSQPFGVYGTLEAALSRISSDIVNIPITPLPINTPDGEFTPQFKIPHLESIGKSNYISIENGLIKLSDHYIDFVCIVVITNGTDVFGVIGGQRKCSINVDYPIGDEHFPEDMSRKKQFDKMYQLFVERHSKHNVNK